MVVGRELVNFYAKNQAVSNEQEITHKTSKTGVVCFSKRMSEMVFVYGSLSSLAMPF